MLSRPGEFHPEPPHRFRTTTRRLDFSTRIHSTRAGSISRSGYAAVGEGAAWLCFLSRSASATNRMPKTIE